MFICIKDLRSVRILDYGFQIPNFAFRFQTLGFLIFMDPGFGVCPLDSDSGFGGLADWSDEMQILEI